MISLIDLLAPRKRLLAQERELRALRRDVAELKARNDSMRKGMRRCLTCDYRLAAKTG